MSETSHAGGTRTYWATWFVLLLLTLGLIFVTKAPLPRAVLLVLLVGVMLTKASLIGANFMHLRFEKVGLALIVMIGILGTAAILFALLAVDGARVLELSTH